MAVCEKRLLFSIHVCTGILKKNDVFIDSCGGDEIFGGAIGYVARLTVRVLRVQDIVILIAFSGLGVLYVSVCRLWW